MNTIKKIALDLNSSSSFKRIILSIILIFLPSLYVNNIIEILKIETSYLFAFIFIINLMKIFGSIQLYNLTYELTSIKEYKSEEKPMYLFWILVQFFIIFSIIVLPVLVFMKEFIPYANFDIINLAINGFLVPIFLIVIIGSRSLKSLYFKLKILSKVNNILFKVFGIIIIYFSFTINFNNYFNLYFQVTFQISIFLFYLIYLIYLIKEFQELYYKGNAQNHFE